MLVVGSELVDDMKKAPDDVLSVIEPMIEVRWRSLTSQTANIHKDYLVRSTRIHSRLIGQRRPVPYGNHPF